MCVSLSLPVVMMPVLAPNGAGAPCRGFLPTVCDQARAAAPNGASDAKCRKTLAHIAVAPRGADAHWGSFSHSGARCVFRNDSETGRYLIPVPKTYLASPEG